MKSEAFLVLHIDHREPGPPRIIAAHIFGESCNTLTLSHKRGMSYCDAYRSGECDSYDEATQRVLDYAKDAGWDWCFKLLEEDWTGSP